MLIVGINASPFDDPHNTEHDTARVLKEALAAARECSATEIDWIHLPEDLPHCDGRREETRYSLEERIQRLPKKGSLEETIRRMIAADGILLCGPTYTFSAESRTCALLAWCEITTDYPEYCLKGKVAGLISVCEEDGGQSANERKFSPCNHMGMIIPPFCSHFYNKHASKSEGDHQKYGHILVGRNVARMIRILQGEILPQDWDDFSASW